MNARAHCDVNIIGTGAGGGTLAHRLAPSGKKMLLVDHDGFLPQETDNWSSEAVVLESKYEAKESWGDNEHLQQDPHFRDYILFHEYFDGESGRDVGASHQTGWTGLVAELPASQRERSASATSSPLREFTPQRVEIGIS